MNGRRCALCRGEIHGDAFPVCFPCADRMEDLSADHRAVILEIIGRGQVDPHTRVLSFTFEVERVTASRHTFTGFPIVPVE